MKWIAALLLVGAADYSVNGTVYDMKEGAALFTLDTLESTPALNNIARVQTVRGVYGEYR